MSDFDNDFDNEDEDDVCQTCNGSGEVTCDVCGGSGMMDSDTLLKDNDLWSPTTTCSQCGGSGREQCHSC